MTDQPFESGTSVLCTRESPEVGRDGSLIDVCRCTKGAVYIVENCWDSPVGWLVEITGELHKAEDFVAVRSRSVLRREALQRGEEMPTIEVLAARIAELEREIAELKRGEFVCQRCHLRKDSEQVDTGF